MTSFRTQTTKFTRTTYISDELFAWNLNKTVKQKRQREKNIDHLDRIKRCGACLVETEAAQWVYYSYIFPKPVQIHSPVPPLSQKVSDIWDFHASILSTGTFPLANAGYRIASSHFSKKKNWQTILDIIAFTTINSRIL